MSACCAKRVVDVPDHVPHIMKGMSKALVVTPAMTTRAEPTADVTMTLADYSLTTSTPLTAGPHVMHGMMHPLTIE